MDDNPLIGWPDIRYPANSKFEPAGERNTASILNGSVPPHGFQYFVCTMHWRALDDHYFVRMICGTTFLSSIHTFHFSFLLTNTKQWRRLLFVILNRCRSIWKCSPTIVQQNRKLSLWRLFSIDHVRELRGNQEGSEDSARSYAQPTWLWGIIYRYHICRDVNFNLTQSIHQNVHQFELRNRDRMNRILNVKRPRFQNKDSGQDYQGYTSQPRLSFIHLTAKT